MIVETEYILLSVHVTFKLLFYCVKVGGKDFFFSFYFPDPNYTN